MSVGNRLLESGHYASQQIQQISGQLEQEWKAFAAALDERSTLLEMSASFHQKADQVQSRNRNTNRNSLQLDDVNRLQLECSGTTYINMHAPCVTIYVYLLFHYLHKHTSTYRHILSSCMHANIFGWNKLLLAAPSECVAVWAYDYWSLLRYSTYCVN